MPQKRSRVIVNSASKIRNAVLGIYRASKTNDRVAIVFCSSIVEYSNTLGASPVTFNSQNFIVIVIIYETDMADLICATIPLVINPITHLRLETRGIMVTPLTLKECL